MNIVIPPNGNAPAIEAPRHFFTNSSSSFVDMIESFNLKLD
jgi:hypothetical protein